MEKPIQKALIDLNIMDLFPSIDEIKVAEELDNALEVVKCGVEAVSSNKCHITMADTIYQFIMKDLTDPKNKNCRAAAKINFCSFL